MNNVNKTMYIPLYGKAYVSEKGLFLSDKKAEETWKNAGFTLRGKAKSKWLAYYMGIRSAVFDDWVKAQAQQYLGAVILHVGCGLDGRVLRVDSVSNPWCDVDFPNVIAERKRYYSETEKYKMIAGDIRGEDWLTNIPQVDCAIVVMEGVSMYLTHEELYHFMGLLARRFSRLVLLMDCYTDLAAKLSKYKNPIKKVGVTKVYGVEDPAFLQQGDFVYVQERAMTPQTYIDELRGFEKWLFGKLYAGKTSKKLYKLYEYKKG